MTLTVEKRPITEHPAFRQPRFDWGIIPAWEDEETGEQFPEDRSGCRPEWQGKSMSEFWDGTQFISSGPKELLGVTRYLVQFLQT